MKTAAKIWAEAQEKFSVELDDAIRNFEGAQKKTKIRKAQKELDQAKESYKQYLEVNEPDNFLLTYYFVAQR